MSSLVIGYIKSNFSLHVRVLKQSHFNDDFNPSDSSGSFRYRAYGWLYDLSSSSGVTIGKDFLYVRGSNRNYDHQIDGYEYLNPDGLLFWSGMLFSAILEYNKLWEPDISIELDDVVVEFPSFEQLKQGDY